MASRQFKVVIASSKWRSPVVSGDRQFKVANRQFKVANRQFKVAIASSKWRTASSKWRSPIQSGDNKLQVVIASSKWRIASSKIYHYTMALNGKIHTLLLTVLEIVDYYIDAHFLILYLNTSNCFTL